MIRSPIRLGAARRLGIRPPGPEHARPGLTLRVRHELSDEEAAELAARFESGRAHLGSLLTSLDGIPGPDLADHVTGRCYRYRHPAVASEGRHR